MTDYQTEREFAVAAVRDACRLTTAVQAALAGAGTTDKSDGSPVTVADFGGQALIGWHLAQRFPGDTVVGEESSAALRETENEALRARVVEEVDKVRGGLDTDGVLAAIDQGAPESADAPLPSRYWTIDPVDGTKGFVRGEHYAVVLALIVDGEVVVGAMGCPRLTMDTGTATGDGVLFSASRGAGATVEPLTGGEARPIHVNDATTGATLGVCESVEAKHNDADVTARVYEQVGVGAAPMKLDGQGKYGMVARGDVGIYLRVHHKPRKENIWDHAAGALIVAEAGGRVSDLDGQPLDFSQGRQLTVAGGILVTNGHIHDRVLDAWKSLQAAE